jgi:hypothetical protein
MIPSDLHLTIHRPATTSTPVVLDDGLAVKPGRWANRVRTRRADALGLPTDALGPRTDTTPARTTPRGQASRLTAPA